MPRRQPTGPVLASDRETVWGTIRDELDVPYIVRYRIRSAGDGPAGDAAA